MTVLQDALTIAATGIPVFPCGMSKKPAIPKSEGGRGFLDAACDPAEVERMFSRKGAKLIGVPTGERWGIDALDLDYRNGAKPWEDANLHRIPETRIHQTQSGGRHLLFKHAPGVRNSAGDGRGGIAPGVDVRGEGGYIILPPSQGYCVIADAEIVEWPDWLLEIVLARDIKKEVRPERTAPIGEISSKRAEGFVRAILQRVSSAGPGVKHYALRNAALSMGGILYATNLSEAQAIDQLLDALPDGVEDWETARKTAEWGIEKGRKCPIEFEDRPLTNAPRTDLAVMEAPAAPKLNGHAVASPPTAEDPSRPVIRVLNGLRHQASDQGLAAMAQAEVAFYQRDRTLVRASLAKAKTSDGKVVEVPGIVPVSLPILARALGSVAEWEKVKSSGEPVRIDPPKEVVEQIAAMSGDWPFPPITGVIATPTMRPDGTLLLKAGYDEMTGLVLLAAPAMPAIPENPTRHDAQMALKVILELLAEFPFADAASRSVALSMILTTVLRGALLPAVPMHVSTAPQPGTGKSYLLDIAAAIATGERCAVIAVAPSLEETEKRLQGAALSGQQIIALDNCSEVLFGDFLNQVTERPLLQLRPLGTSTVVRIANTFTVFANGNNLVAPADLVRRTLVCRLDANLENPEERVFSANPVRTVLENRGHYVAACLTIGRAYVSAGSPDTCKQLPSFERWSDLVRSALVWLDMPDPCSSMELARAEDPIRLSRAAVFDAWAKEIGLNPNGMMTSELIAEADALDAHGMLHPRFREACLSVAAERTGTTISSRRLGKWLLSSNNNRVGDLKLSVNRQDATRPRWVLSRC